MGRWTLAVLTAVALTAMAPKITRGQTELIANGGFETGDFSGWTLSSSRPLPDGWWLNDGSFLPAGPGQFTGPLAVISGNLDATTNQTGPGVQQLVSNVFVVPSGVSRGTVSFSDRLRNWAGIYLEGVQEFRVELLDAGGGTVAEIFATASGDATEQLGPNHRVFDVTDLLRSLEGQELQLAFTVRAQAFFFNVTIDDVSVSVEDSSGPAVLEAAIDVKPGSESNPIRLKQSGKARGHSHSSGGVLPVAVLSDAEFDARDVDATTVWLGDPVLGGSAGPMRVGEEDVDGDGAADLMLHFSIVELIESGALDAQTEWLMLGGSTSTGAPFAGLDAVHVVP